MTMTEKYYLYLKVVQNVLLALECKNDICESLSRKHTLLLHHLDEFF
jgi:hypothetical protein